jgi:hypothetical protein
MLKSPAYRQAFLRRFLPAQAGLGIAVFALIFTNEFVEFIEEQWWILALGVLACELAVVMFILWILPPVEDDPEFFADPEKKKTVMRFATSNDNDSTESVYEEWFSDSIAMVDEEYRKIVAREKFVRVAEVTKQHSYGISTFVSGYYAVFPMSQQTLEDLYTGKRKEKDLASNDVLDFDHNDARVLYICEAISSKKCSVRHELMGDLLSYCAYIVSANPQICTVATWPYTKYGINSVKKRRFRKISKGWRTGSFYEQSVERIALKGVRKFKDVHTISYS